MEQKRVCKVCGEEKSIDYFGFGDPDVCVSCKTRVSLYGQPMQSTKGLSMGSGGYIRSFSDAEPRFIPSPRMTIATAAMQSLLSNKHVANSAEFLAKKAVEYADALLEKLSEPKDGV